MVDWRVREESPKHPVGSGRPGAGEVAGPTDTFKRGVQPPSRFSPALAEPASVTADASVIPASEVEARTSGLGRRPGRGWATGPPALQGRMLPAGNRAVAALIARQHATTAPPQTTPISTPGGSAVQSLIREAMTRDELKPLIEGLVAVAASAPADRTESMVVDTGVSSIMIASYEAHPLLREAQAAAAALGGPEGLRGGEVRAGDVVAVRQRLLRAKAVTADPQSNLTRDQRVEIERAISVAEVELSRYEHLAAQGSGRRAGMAPLALASGVLIADDATGIGFGDDPLLILVGLAAIGVLIVTSPSTPQPELDATWRRVGESLNQIGEVGTAIMMAVQGPRAAGQLTNVARHLARLLALGAVGGVPSGEPPKRNDDDDPHWWAEIKGSIRQFWQATKGASRRQIMRELSKHGFTEAQVAAIEAALLRAAKQMGEVIGTLLPPP